MRSPPGSPLLRAAVAGVVLSMIPMAGPRSPRAAGSAATCPGAPATPGALPHDAPGPPPGGAAADRDAPPAAAGDLHREVLPGGAVIIMLPVPGSETFALRVMVRGGAAGDAHGSEGLTRLLSRLILRGTRDHTAAELALSIESTGASIEPVAGFLGFGAAASGPSAAAATVLHMAMDAVLNPLLSDEECESEKKLLTRELRTSLDVPAARLERAALSLMMGDHPLGRAPDPATGLEGITPAALREAHAGRARADRLVVVVTGGIDPAALAPAISRRLPGSAAGAVPPPPAPPPPHHPPISERVKGRTPQPEIIVALPTRGVVADEGPAMDLLVHLLTGHQERIGTRIREENGWAYWLRAVDIRYPTAGAFGVRTAVPGKHLAASEAIILDEMRRIARVPPAQAELDRARRYLETSRARAWQRSTYRAAWLAAAELKGEPVIGLTAQDERMAPVTPEDIRSLAQRLLDGSEPAVITIR